MRNLEPFSRDLALYRVQRTNLLIVPTANSETSVNCGAKAMHYTTIVKEISMFQFRASLCRGIAVSVLALFGSWATSSQAATYSIYTDQTSWTAAALQIRQTLYTTSIVTQSDLSGYGLPADYYYYDPQALEPLQHPGLPALGKAFAGNFDLTPGGNGGGLAFLINFADSTSAVVWGLVNYPSGFLGVVSDTAINSVEPFSDDTTGNGETFNYDLLTVRFQLNVCLSCRPIR
jgi:hypothetical protein